MGGAAGSAARAGLECKTTIVIPPGIGMPGKVEKLFDNI
jgi:hypothetical protein